MITYLIEVSICWLLFYGIYMLLLKKETFFNINRWYLLSTLGLGLVIPLFTVDFSSLFHQESTSSVVYLAEGVSEFEYVISNSVEQAQAVDYSWLTLVQTIYFIGILVTLTKFLYGFRQIYSLYRTGTITQKGKYKLVLTETPHLPFSFFHYLFWHKDTALEDTDSGKIITHELAHINQWHSIDIIILETLGILLWFSPPIYWYKKSLRAVHEFLADAYVLRDTKKKQYGHLLIRQVQSGMQISLANNFIHSQLKQRINMMTRNQSRRKELMRYLPALPLLLLMVLVFSNKNVQNNFNETTAKASLAFENIWEGDFNPKFAKEKMRTAFRDDSKNVYATKTGEPIDLDAQKMKELHREYKRQIASFPEKESDIRLLMMEVSAENGYKVRFIGKNMSYKEIDGFEKGEEIKMQIDKGNLPTTQLLTDTLPIFPSGEKEMLRFIYTNIKYPAEARQKGIQGDLTAQFTVEKDGSISNLKIKNDLGGGLKEEVLRVMKLVQEMPEKWTPAMTNGVATRSTYELPFEYRLEGQNKDGAWRSKNDPVTVKEGRSIVIVGRYNSTTEEVKKTDDKDINLLINPVIQNKSINGEPVYKIADENPRFPGCGTAKEYNAKLKNCGDEKMLQFIYENIKYPNTARAQGIEGTVVVRFIVKKDGSLSDEKILRNIGGGTGEEALRVVNLMKEKNIRWIPGIIDGQPVNFNFNLPIKFRLDADAKKEIRNTH